MKILLIGQSKGNDEVSNGPAIVLNGLYKALLKSNNEVKIFPRKKRNFIVNYFILFFILLKKWDVINVHLHATYGLLVGVMRFRSNNTVLTIHGYNGIEITPQKWYSKFIQKIQIKFLFTNRIYVSNLQKELINKKLNISGGIVIYNGIDSSWAKEENQLYGKKYDLISICGYSKTKGVDFLLETLVKQKLSLKTCIIGPYKENFDISNYPADLLDKLELKGNLNHIDVVNYLSTSKIYINPSYYESFGISTLEALSLGIPTIVSRGAGISEILTHGLDSFIIEYGDHKSLLAYIEILLNDINIYNSISRNAKITASKFNWDVVSDDYVSYFSSFSNQR